MRIAPIRLVDGLESHWRERWKTCDGLSRIMKCLPVVYCSYDYNNEGLSRFSSVVLLLPCSSIHQSCVGRELARTHSSHMPINSHLLSYHSRDAPPLVATTESCREIFNCLEPRDHRTFLSKHFFKQRLPYKPSTYLALVHQSAAPHSINSMLISISTTPYPYQALIIANSYYP